MCMCVCVCARACLFVVVVEIVSSKCDIGLFSWRILGKQLIEKASSLGDPLAAFVLRLLANKQLASKKRQQQLYSVLDMESLERLVSFVCYWTYINTIGMSRVVVAYSIYGL